MNEHFLRFPSGRTVAQAKKDAKRLKASSTSDLTYSAALNQIARENGLAMSWAEAMVSLAGAIETSDVRSMSVEDLHDLVAPLRFSSGQPLKAISRRFPRSDTQDPIHGERSPGTIVEGPGYRISYRETDVLAELRAQGNPPRFPDERSKE